MEKFRLVFAIFILSALLFSCKEEHVIEKEEPLEMYVKGEILFVFKPEVTIDQAFNLFNEKGLVISRMSGFHFGSALPNDQLAFVTSVIQAKTYISSDVYTVKIDRYSNSITMNPAFHDMDAGAQDDWRKTMVDLQLQMEVKQNLSKRTLFKVTPGTEDQWVRDLENHELAKYVLRNSIIRLNAE